MLYLSDCIGDTLFKLGSYECHCFGKKRIGPQSALPHCIVLHREIVALCWDRNGRKAGIWPKSCLPAAIARPQPKWPSWCRRATSKLKGGHPKVLGNGPVLGSSAASTCSATLQVPKRASLTSQEQEKAFYRPASKNENLHS